MNILFIGDIMGRSGRDAVFDFLPQIKHEYNIDLVIANGENSSGGLGMSLSGYDELRRAGIDFFTMGNHTFSKKEVLSLFADNENIIRPANLPADTIGNGIAIFTAKCGVKVAIINLLGRIYMTDSENLDSPFTTADKLIEQAKALTNVIILDIHAEATSEKLALGYYLDGRVSAVLGTHTHVQTADERILPNGTAYITDVGMTGAVNSVLGMDIDTSLSRFLEPEKKGKFKIAKPPYQLCGIVVTINDESGKAEKVVRLCQL